MTIFGFDLTSAIEFWLLTCLCSGFANGIVRGFCKAWKEYKEEEEKKDA